MYDKYKDRKTKFKSINEQDLNDMKLQIKKPTLKLQLG